MTIRPLRQRDASLPAVEDLSIEYPSSDGEPMAESDLQYVPLTETVSVLRTRFFDRSDVYIAGDMLVYYRINDNTVSVAPDLFAVFGATGNHPRDSWLLWREGKAPDFVMEIASESTWRRDVGEAGHLRGDGCVGILAVRPHGPVVHAGSCGREAGGWRVPADTRVGRLFRRISGAQRGARSGLLRGAWTGTAAV